jgi:hypothetical protein
MSYPPENNIPAFCRHRVTRPIDYSKRIDFERLFGIDYSKRIDFERLFPIFGTCRPGGDRKREYYFGFISDGAWFCSFLRVLRHDFCSIVSNGRFLIQNRVIEAFPTPKAEK